MQKSPENLRSLFVSTVNIKSVKHPTKRNQINIQFVPRDFFENSGVNSFVPRSLWFWVPPEFKKLSMFFSTRNESFWWQRVTVYREWQCTAVDCSLSVTLYYTRETVTLRYAVDLSLSVTLYYTRETVTLRYAVDCHSQCVSRSLYSFNSNPKPTLCDRVVRRLIYEYRLLCSLIKSRV